MQVQEKKHRGKRVLAVLVLLSLLAAVNFKIVEEPLIKFIREDLSFEDFTNEIQTGYLSDSFTYKNDFVNINGLFARLTGRRTLNEVVKLNNGMLGETRPSTDITALANGIKAFSDYLNEQNVPFLYIQMPYKESLVGQSFPVGITSFTNKNADNLLSRLLAEDVETLDLRPSTSQTSEMLERYFYRTDRHWNSDGAFVAFQEILGRLYELLPEGEIDLTYVQDDQWERHSIDDWYLGSQGRRVGIFFGGIEPLTWHTPKFETEMSCVIPQRGDFFRGDFADANIRTQYIEEKKFFADDADDAYAIYTGGDYPLVSHRNLYAPSPLKVLMIKDSFTRPLQAFFSTIFQEVDVIDPRYFTECTIAEYADQTEPDVVIVAMCAGALWNTKFQNYGVENAALFKIRGENCETVVHQDIDVQISENDHNNVAYPLVSNMIYRLSFGRVDVLEGKTEGVGLRIYNKTTKTVLKNVIFDIAYSEATGGYTWTFRTPNTQDELSLLFYAGIYGSTAGNSVVYRDVTLEKLHNSDG